MDSKTYDLIIIGAGAAGLTSAIYASREAISTLVLEKDLCGGLTASTDLIENYPGFPQGIKGQDLIAKFKEQAQKFGAQIQEFREVKKIVPLESNIKVITEDEEYQAHSLIVASGSLPKMLNIPGEKALKGKGVSYCATCDGPLFKNKDVAIIGCGNSGLQEGEALLNYVKTITFVEFLPYISAQKILEQRLKQNKKVTFLCNHQIASINGREFVESITVKERTANKEKTIAVQGVFIYVGYVPHSDFVKNLLNLDRYGYVITDKHMRTNIPGIFAAGDIRSKEVRQIDVACGEATVAAISVRDYLKQL